MLDIRRHQFFKDIIALPYVEVVWLFGSRARGDHRERSDIDLAILCPKATSTDWHQILEILEKADTLLNIDCVRFDTIDATSKLKKNVLDVGKVLFERNAPIMETIYFQDSFDTLGNALDRLGDVLGKPDLDTNEYFRDATIQRFEFVIELYWKTLRKCLAFEKIEATTPRDTLKKAYQFEMINDEHVWLDMLDDRNNTSHAYSEREAREILLHIKGYYPTLRATYDRLKERFGL